MEKPSVEAPLGDFFGVGHGAVADFHSQPVSVSSFGRSRTCWWRMPFRKSARVTLTNERRGFGDTEDQPFVDGRSVGPEVDLNVREEDWTWFSFDLHDLNAGKHTLNLEGRGASPSQRTKAQMRFAIGLNSIVLLRLDDLLTTP